MALGLLLGVLFNAVQLEGCIKEFNQETRKYDCPAYGFPSYWLAVLLSFLNDNAGAIAGLAGVAVAAFTGVLWLSTDKLWKETRRIASEGKAQHAITNRAFVSVDEVTCVKVDPSDPIKGRIFQITLINAGNTPTKEGVVRCGVAVEPGELPDQFSYPYEEKHTRRAFLPPRGPMSCLGVVVGHKDVTAAFNGKKFIYLYGIIEYRDALAPKETRWTRWCLRFETVPSAGDSQMVTFAPYGDYNGTELG